MPFLVSGKQLAISASIGIAFAGDAEDISRELIRVADAAMYEAKRDGGGGHQISDYRSASANGSTLPAPAGPAGRVRPRGARGGLPAHRASASTGTGHGRGGPAALDTSRPRPDGPADSGRGRGAERADQPRSEHGCSSVPAATASPGFQQDPGANIDVAVNVSAGQFMGADFSATASAVLEATGMDPAALVLEITEGVLIADRERRQERAGIDQVTSA